MATSTDMFLVNAKDATTAGDILDLVKAAAPRADVFVAPFSNDQYAYSLREGSKVGAWLKKQA